MTTKLGMLIFVFQISLKKKNINDLRHQLSYRPLAVDQETKSMYMQGNLAKRINYQPKTLNLVTLLGFATSEK